MGFAHSKYGVQTSTNRLLARMQFDRHFLCELSTAQDAERNQDDRMGGNII
jgi:hypothetical protein